MMGRHLVPFCGIIIRICTFTLSVVQQYNLGNVRVWNNVSGTLAECMLLWLMQVVSNLDLWTHIQVGLTLWGDKNSQVTNGGGNTRDGNERLKKKSSSISEILGKVTLDESCFCGLCNCPVWIILYSLVPTRLPQLCLLHHCFTGIRSHWNYQDIHIFISCWELDVKVSISGSFSKAMASIA